MNATLKRLAGLLAVGLPLVLGAHAETYTKTDGVAYDGDIYKVLDGAVFLRVGDDKVSTPIAEFDAASQAAIEAWAEENPFRVDVYTKWDVQPAIKSSSMPKIPEQFLAEEFKGMVSVDLVLNEAGQVIHASIKKSTHPDLEAPSLEAARSWLFVPARIGGETVRSKLRVPFKFVHTPAPAVEEIPAG